MARLSIIALLVVSLVTYGFGLEPPSPMPPAMVHASHETYVDGTKVLDTMSIFPGENVETRSGEFASVIVSGTSLRVLGLSRIRYLGSSAEVISGGVSATTTTRYTLRSNCYSVQPISNSSSRFDIVPYKGRIYIAAQQGELLIEAKKDFRVPVGRTAAITGCGTPSERIELAGGSDLALKVFLGGAAGAAAYPFIPSQSKQCISAESPTTCR